MTKEKVSELLAAGATHLTANTSGAPFAAHGSEEWARKHRLFLIEIKGEDADNVRIVEIKTLTPS